MSDFDASNSRFPTRDETAVAVDSHALLAEHRVNLVRISAIAIFYVIHLWHVSAEQLGDWATTIFGFEPGLAVDPNVHVGITVLCAGWLFQSFALHLSSPQLRIADRTILISTLADLGWLTAIQCLSTGPAGPMVAGYFLIICLTGLRFDLRLVRITTVAAVVCYLLLLGVAQQQFGGLNRVELQSVPRYHQMMTVLAIVFTGVIVGQMVRQAYSLHQAVAMRSEERSK